MSNSPYLISIVVPTKDRYECLKSLIELVISFNSDLLELVIQDNTSENNHIVGVLKDKAYPHIKYYHIYEQLPISQNADYAIKNSSGEYICFIGDDDAILPSIIECALWMKTNSVDSLTSASVIYNWPDYVNLANSKQSAGLFFNDFSSVCRRIDPIRGVTRMARTGFRSIKGIPKLYQGIVKRTTLDKLYSACNTYFPGQSPDMASSVALAFVVNSHVHINLPVIITGQSRTVGGGERELKGGVKPIESVPFLTRNARESWDRRIPKVWCTQTVWPESGTSALRKMKKEGSVFINYEFILANFIHTHKLERSLAVEISKNLYVLKAYLAYLYLEKISRAIKWRLKKLFSSKNRISNSKNHIQHMNDVVAVNTYFVKNHKKYLTATSYDKLSCR